jgi:2-haloacid dehalogenase
MSIEAVVFDIGNVLIRWDVRALYRTVFDDPDEMERFLAEVWTPMENDRCDRGTAFFDVINENIERHPAYEAEIRMAWDRWIETVPGPIEGAFELVAELNAAGVALHALSNFSAETFPLVRDAYPQFELIGEIVISGENPPLAKPDQAIFELLCERAGIEPETTVFIDDASTNTDAAAQLGFVTVTFTDTAALRVELAALGLPVST